MCECNGSPFTKLRESWSRHYKNELHGDCNCCCKNKNGKTKMKGKFGVAYIIETPDRKCKPCGWEVEFNDTPSQIESNCKKMMNWVTCPPLGECQNNQTNFCCCSNAQKEVLSVMNQICRTSAKQNTCSCNKEKRRTTGGDCCCKKPQRSCCCEKAANQCCLTDLLQNNNQKQCCCSKPKEKTNCNCRALSGQQAYLNSKNKCTCCAARSNENISCCLSSKHDDDECCCGKIMETTKCSCQSDSQSSLELCRCQKGARRKNKKECACNCNCSGCKCAGNTKGHSKPKKTDPAASHEIPKAKIESHHKSSKNFLSPEPKEERHIGTQRSPYTISTSEIPKKGPDKGVQNFYDELTKRIMEIDDNKAGDFKLLSQDETEIKDDEYSQQEPSPPAKPPRKKIKGADLLKMIKEEHKKEMEAIHPKSHIPEKKEAPIGDLKRNEDENQNETDTKIEDNL